MPLGLSLAPPCMQESTEDLSTEREPCSILTLGKSYYS